METSLKSLHHAGRWNRRRKKDEGRKMSVTTASNFSAAHFSARKQPTLASPATATGPDKGGGNLPHEVFS